MSWGSPNANGLLSATVKDIGKSSSQLLRRRIASLHHQSMEEHEVDDVPYAVVDNLRGAMWLGDSMDFLSDLVGNRKGPDLPWGRQSEGLQGRPRHSVMGDPFLALIR